jgi:uncharacterized protein (TIGR02270 family)
LIPKRFIHLDSRNLVTIVIRQHAEDAAALHASRTRLVTAPHVKLHHIRRFDDRLSANLDGLLIAGSGAWPLLDEALSRLSCSAVFCAVVNAVETGSTDRLKRLYSLGEAIHEAQDGLISALGWLEKDRLRGIVSGLLASPSPYLRLLGFSACSIHRVDPGRARDAAIEDPAAASALRSRALRAAGELGRLELSSACLGMLHADEADCRFWAAWSAVLLGNKAAGLESLRTIGESAGPFRRPALRLSIQAADQADAQRLLQKLAPDPANLRWLIQGSGIAGDPTYVPWLIGHMNDNKTARLAGEAFSLITGLDLAYLDLDRKPPGDPGAGPNDDPEDSNVEMGEDDGLPWPDPGRIENWWRANGGRFSPGTRYFSGGAVTRENCLRVLKEGYQRQRILAAHYLCLLEPGRTLFEWRAPAFRQERLLAGMI